TVAILPESVLRLRGQPVPPIGPSGARREGLLAPPTTMNKKEIAPSVSANFSQIPSMSGQIGLRSIRCRNCCIYIAPLFSRHGQGHGECHTERTCDFAANG